MGVDLFCSRSHYAAHVRPVFDALPEDYRGTAYSMRMGEWWATAPLPARARLWPSQPVLVGSWVDARRCQGRPVIMVEHGAGQAYQGDPRSATLGSYSGGDGLDHVVLFICPNETVAQRWSQRYPDAVTAVCGDPFLDAWLDGPRRVYRDGRLTVALTWHWEADFVPEMRSAFPHYRDALPGLKEWADDHKIFLVGHAHPRAWGTMRRRYAELGIHTLTEWPDVIMAADILVADNTSAMWEWCALDRPIVVLDAPWYRRDIDHGLRFWEHADAGPRIGDPSNLIAAVSEAIENPDRYALKRQVAARRTYSFIDGKSAARAADAVIRVTCS